MLKEGATKCIAIGSIKSHEEYTKAILAATGGNILVLLFIDVSQSTERTRQRNLSKIPPYLGA